MLGIAASTEILGMPGDVGLVAGSSAPMDDCGDDSDGDPEAPSDASVETPDRGPSPRRRARGRVVLVSPRALGLELPARASGDLAIPADGASQLGDLAQENIVGLFASRGASPVPLADAVVGPLAGCAGAAPGSVTGASPCGPKSATPARTPAAALGGVCGLSPALAAPEATAAGPSESPAKTGTGTAAGVPPPSVPATGAKGEPDASPAPPGPEPASRPSPPGRTVRCQVVGCASCLAEMRDYNHRYKICEKHLRAEHVMHQGSLQRFCQQCGRFHEISAFDGSKRSCRVRLEKHNARRRRLREQHNAHWSSRPRTVAKASKRGAAALAAGAGAAAVAAAVAATPSAGFSRGSDDAAGRAAARGGVSPNARKARLGAAKASTSATAAVAAATAALGDAVENAQAAVTDADTVPGAASSAGRRRESESGPVGPSRAEGSAASAAPVASVVRRGTAGSAPSSEGQAFAKPQTPVSPAAVLLARPAGDPFADPVSSPRPHSSALAARSPSAAAATATAACATGVRPATALSSPPSPRGVTSAYPSTSSRHSWDGFGLSGSGGGVPPPPLPETPTSGPQLPPPRLRLLRPDSGRTREEQGLVIYAYVDAAASAGAGSGVVGSSPASGGGGAAGAGDAGGAGGVLGPAPSGPSPVLGFGSNPSSGSAGAFSVGEATTPTPAGPLALYATFAPGASSAGTLGLSVEGVAVWREGTEELSPEFIDATAVRGAVDAPRALSISAESPSWAQAQQQQGQLGQQGQQQQMRQQMQQQQHVQQMQMQMQKQHQQHVQQMQMQKQHQQHVQQMQMQQQQQEQQQQELVQPMLVSLPLAHQFASPAMAAQRRFASPCAAFPAPAQGPAFSASSSLPVPNLCSQQGVVASTHPSSPPPVSYLSTSALVPGAIVADASPSLNCAETVESGLLRELAIGEVDDGSFTRVPPGSGVVGFSGDLSGGGRVSGPVALKGGAIVSPAAGPFTSAVTTSGTFQTSVVAEPYGGPLSVETTDLAGSEASNPAKVRRTATYPGASVGGAMLLTDAYALSFTQTWNSASTAAFGDATYGLGAPFAPGSPRQAPPTARPQPSSVLRADSLGSASTAFGDAADLFAARSKVVLSASHPLLAHLGAPADWFGPTDMRRTGAGAAAFGAAAGPLALAGGVAPCGRVSSAPGTTLPYLSFEQRGAPPPPPPPGPRLGPPFSSPALRSSLFGQHPSAEAQAAPETRGSVPDATLACSMLEHVTSCELMGTRRSEPTLLTMHVPPQGSTPPLATQAQGVGAGASATPTTTLVASPSRGMPLYPPPFPAFGAGGFVPSSSQGAHARPQPRLCPPQSPTRVGSSFECSSELEPQPTLDLSSLPANPMCGSSSLPGDAALDLSLLHASLERSSPIAALAPPPPKRTSPTAPIEPPPRKRASPHDHGRLERAVVATVGGSMVLPSSGGREGSLLMPPSSTSALAASIPMGSLSLAGQTSPDSGTCLLVPSVSPEVTGAAMASTTAMPRATFAVAAPVAAAGPRCAAAPDVATSPLRSLDLATSVVPSRAPEVGAPATAPATASTASSTGSSTGSGMEGLRAFCRTLYGCELEALPLDLRRSLDAMGGSQGNGL